MSKHKKQHFVPSSYLKAWCDPECSPKYSPYVWRFSFDGTESRKKSPDNIFHETDMYTIRRRNGERDLRLEHGLQQLETKFARIRRKILQRQSHILYTVLMLSISTNMAGIALIQGEIKKVCDSYFYATD